jgi:hypothetical protein
VNAGLRHAGELEDLVIVGQPQLEPRRAQPEPEERRQVYCRTLT